MQKVKLTHGKEALVDDDFMEKTIRLADLDWHAIKSKSGNYHAACTLVMHRMVIPVARGMIVDHIDQNGLNNQAVNLREVTSAGNAANRPTEKSSKYIGVTKIKIKSGIRYRAYFIADGKYVCIGHYRDEVTAAQQRDAAYIEYYGTENAELNFPLDGVDEDIDNMESLEEADNPNLETSLPN